MCLVQAGDRAPDVEGLQQQGTGFPLRLFEVLRGTGHVLIVRLELGQDARDCGFEAFAGELKRRYQGQIRLVAVTEGALGQHPHMTLLRDSQQRIGAAYGPAWAFVVRPDGYIGWRGNSWQDPGLPAYLEASFGRIP